MVVVQDKPVVGMEGSMDLAEVDSKALAEVGSMVLEVDSMVLVEVGSTARGLALGTAGNTPAGDKLAEGEVHEQAHAGVEPHKDCRAEVQDKVQGIAGDRAGRPAAGILAQGRVEDMAQGRVEDMAQGMVGE